MAVTSSVACARAGETLALDPSLAAAKATAVSALALALARAPMASTVQSSAFGPLVTHDTLAYDPRRERWLAALCLPRATIPPKPCA